MRYKGEKGKAWDALRHYIYKRDDYQCSTCWKSGYDGYKIDAGHYLPMGLCGSNCKLGWDELNIHAQCSHCNNTGQGQQELMGHHINKTYGKGTTDKLRKRLGKVDPIKDWKELREYYEEKMRLL